MDIRSLESISHELNNLRKNISEGVILCTEVALELKRIGENYQDLKETVKTVQLMDDGCEKLRSIICSCRDHKRLPTIHDQTILEHLTPETLSNQVLTDNEVLGSDGHSLIKTFLKSIDEEEGNGGSHSKSSDLTSHGGDEVLIMSHKQDLLCPITKQLLESPVYNLNCHHYYSDKAIRRLIARRQHISCPVIGK